MRHADGACKRAQHGRRCANRNQRFRPTRRHWQVCWLGPAGQLYRCRPGQLRASLTRVRTSACARVSAFFAEFRFPQILEDSGVMIVGPQKQRTCGPFSAGFRDYDMVQCPANYFKIPQESAKSLFVEQLLVASGMHIYVKCIQSFASLPSHHQTTRRPSILSPQLRTRAARATGGSGGQLCRQQRELSRRNSLLVPALQARRYLPGLWRSIADADSG